LAVIKDIIHHSHSFPFLYLYRYNFLYKADVEVKSLGSRIRIYIDIIFYIKLMWKLNHLEVECGHKTKDYNILIHLEVLIVRTNEYIRCDNYRHNELLF